MKKTILIFLFLLGGAWQSSAAYTIVHTPTVVSNGGPCGAGTPCTYANPFAYTQVDFVVVMICWQSTTGTLATVTGSVNASGWNLRTTSVAHDTTNTLTCEITDAQNISTSGTETLSVTFSGGAIFNNYAFFTEITGVNSAADPGDQFSGQFNGAASTTYLSASITPGTSGDIIIAVWTFGGAANTISSWTPTASPAFTAITANASPTAIPSEYFSQAVAASIAPTIVGANSTVSSGLLMSYKPATGGSPGGVIGGNGKLGGNGVIGLLIVRKEERC